MEFSSLGTEGAEALPQREKAPRPLLLSVATAISKLCCFCRVSDSFAPGIPTGTRGQQGARGCGMRAYLLILALMGMGAGHIPRSRGEAGEEGVWAPPSGGRLIWGVHVLLQAQGAGGREPEQGPWGSLGVHRGQSWHTEWNHICSHLGEYAINLPLQQNQHVFFIKNVREPIICVCHSHVCCFF